MLNSENNEKRKLRQERVRKRVRGTDQKPRLCVFRSARHIYVQVISDDAGKTLVSASTLSAELRGASPSGEAAKAKKIEVAKKVGELVAKRCLEQQISQVIFDRNGFLFHGRIKALADAAREAGLKF